MFLIYRLTRICMKSVPKKTLGFLEKTACLKNHLALKSLLVNFFSPIIRQKKIFFTHPKWL